MSGRAGHIRIAVVVVAFSLAACEDLDSFTTSEGQIYRGVVVDADIVRAGFASGTQLEMTFDVTLVDEGPGVITTYPPGEDGEPGHFDNAPLLPIAALRNDSLSGFDFPSGRLQNYMFMTTASGTYEGLLALVIVSLLSNGDVEIRVILGPEDLYGIFTLEKTGV
jgi:hypothetical protein